MMVFPGAGARVYYNDAGEPLGWDYPSDDPRDAWDEWQDREPEPDREPCDECDKQWADEAHARDCEEAR
jgi:hypothetical protein